MLNRRMIEKQMDRIEKGERIKKDRKNVLSDRSSYRGRDTYPAHEQWQDGQHESTPSVSTS